MIGTIGVVIPAVDEEATISRCLSSVAVARDRLREAGPRKIEVQVLVVLDRCADTTPEIVRRHLDVDAIVCTAGRVGAARAAGTRALLSRFTSPLQELWLTNTDADSVVPSDWLVEQIEEADRGVHLVLGTCLPEKGLPALIERAWYSIHSLSEGHPHIHGANLGLRADAYMAVGGWPDLPTGEDAALVERATAMPHLNITRTARIPVRTSSRLTGRAPGGFAAYLRDLQPPAEELV